METVSYQPLYPKGYQGNFATPMIVAEPPTLESLQERTIQDSILNNTQQENPKDPFNIEQYMTIEKMFEARLHLGHDSRRRHPLMNRYVFGERFGIELKQKKSSTLII